MSIRNFLNSKITIILLSLVITFQLLFFGLREVKATSVTSLSGTYGCIYNANFSGFMTKTKNGQGIDVVNSLVTITFTSGSNNVVFRGVVNSTNNFEGVTPTNSIDTNYQGQAVYTANSPATNFFKISDTSTGKPLDSYFLIVNSGNTIFFLDGLTDSRNANGVCQLL